mmetsp:Transcript_22971/g.73873  ORF Transcript_22971/g.73873 Transcript_22971/m.73873 type:complete len:188 (+) Transcript_22971:21-584(+)|eukprot:CAMPEP_0118912612 /NCGR_PEP_ID=MMETSP1166-20130328/13780_1 /TAXON_ID=1104430 /ORGANISM="Chrysoreinhardia sp, Strain CCMP3193" /LENGTH=187 /DNA_ID=CAMNT_0006852131 /DNA_START=1 /DNA_END=564 /DNA_ORIENTATION=+
MSSSPAEVADLPTVSSPADVVLRRWCPGDETTLVAQANDKEVSRNLRDRFPHPYTLKDAEEWIAYAATSATNFAIVVAGKAVGGVGLELGSDVHRKTAEVGYWLGRDYWGRGIATAVVTAVTSWAFRTHDLVRLDAGVYASNPASARVLEKAGYRFEGRLRKSVFKDGLHLDQLLYAAIAEPTKDDD